MKSPTAALGSGWRWLPVTALVIGADQASKAWIVSHMAYGGIRTLLPVLDLTLRYNRGAAWSMLDSASGWQRWLFSGLAVVVGIGLLYWLRRIDGRTQQVLSLSLALILAGALGNLIDRLFGGQVVDFILAHWNDAQFPAFNVADSAITVGAALMLLDAFTDRRSSN
ncbi:MAG TPA: signal peptidase II [Steroidobacteraceae bacterium]|nr:signal peptidase II [Steroidobacteraceae bacterium]